METIKTKTGKVYNIRNCGSIGDEEIATLYIEIIGKNIQEVVDVFYNPEENNKIEHYDEDGELKETFMYFNMLYEAKRIYENDNIKIRLEKKIET